MSIFKCLNDPQVGPRLKALGVTDSGLAKYIVDRANGVSEKEALFDLLRRDLDLKDATFINEIVDQFPIPH